MLSHLAAVVPIVLLLAGIGLGAAQQKTGEIFGRSVDPTGAALGGTTVTVTGPALLQPRIATTSDGGTYRVAELPVGAYSVTFEHAGFRTVARTGIQITIGFRAQIDTEMEIAGLAETLTVAGHSPIIDTRSTGTKTSFDLETLQNLPSARDPWALLERTPAIAMDRVNVGGSQSGQQSEFVSRGADTTNNKWSIDGVDITDMTATGASPIYYDFDMLEQMQVTTSGAGVAQQTGGVVVNLVTRGGTDRFKGSGRFYVTDDRFEASNVTDAARAGGAGSGAPIQNIKDYGFEVGGPIATGKAWYWGSYGTQDVKVGVVGFYTNNPVCRPTPPTDSVALRECLETDLTNLHNYNWKLQWAPFDNNKLSFQNTWAEKVRNARDASDTRPLETTQRQKATDDLYGGYGWLTGPSPLLKASDQHVLSDRWLTEVQWAHLGNNFTLDFHDDSLAGVQPRIETTTGAVSRSYQRQIILRPTNSLDVTTSYFLPGRWGGDHAISGGIRLRSANARTLTHWGGNAVARYTNGVANSVDLYRDGDSVAHLNTFAIYAEDAYTVSRLTLTSGVRLDVQGDEARPAAVPASPLAPILLPAVAFPGADANVTWTDLSPRVGLTYDLTGKGRTLINASYANYYGQMAPGQLSGELAATDAVFVRYPWTDGNGDGFVQLNEVNTAGAPLSRSAAYDPASPANFRSPGFVDPDIQSDRTREFVVGFDHELAPNMGIGASYIRRRYDRFSWQDRVGFTSADYRAVRYAPAGCPAGARCGQVTYYEPTTPLPAAFVRANTPDRSRGYNGLEVTFRKRQSGRWSASASYALNSAVDHYDSAGAYEDPTNIASLDGAQYAPESTDSGIDSVFTNARWLLRGTGSYRLPWSGVTISGAFQSRQGYPFPQSVLSPDRANSAGTVQVLLDPPGAVRLDALRYADLRIDRRFAIGAVTVTGSLDVFNVGNAGTVLARRRNQAAANANAISGILAPRVLRFGFRVGW